MSDKDRIKAIIENTAGLGKGWFEQFVTARNYEAVLPIRLSDFRMPAILPTIFYLFDTGKRRGRGAFTEKFSGGIKSETNARAGMVTADNISKELAGTTTFKGFEGDTEGNILGDMLLAFCLENKGRALGRDKLIQRIAATHYMSSWVDRPPDSSDQRNIPELIVAILAAQEKGDDVHSSSDTRKSRFKVGGQAYKSNSLLKAFNQGIYKEETLGLGSDQYNESEVALDQLLTIRLAQFIGHAPKPITRKTSKTIGPNISNQRPIAKLASEDFHHDMRKFILDYSSEIPRQVFLEMFETCMAVGLTNIFNSVVNIMLEWQSNGKIQEKQDQQPAAVFLDCSNGIDRNLRGYAEDSMDGVIRKAKGLPTTLLAVRLLDYYGENNAEREYNESNERIPYADKHLNFLGDILLNEIGRDARKDVEKDINLLVKELDKENDDDDKDIIQTLKDSGQTNPVWRLADGLQLIRQLFHKNEVMELLKCLLMSDYPNGIARQRRVNKSPDRYSMVLTDSLIDYLVHLEGVGHKSGTENSLNTFKSVLIEKYGFYIDQAPPGTGIPADMLRKNRDWLERKLRDLGLLVGVNDAESMKRLKLRFSPSRFIQPEGDQDDDAID